MRIKLRQGILFLFSFLFICNMTFAAQLSDKKQFVDAFVTKMVRKHHFNRASLNKLFAQIKIDDLLIQKMKTRKEGKPWHVYRNFFITNKRIKGGVKFWQTHERTLARAEKQFGVPSSIIVALIGIESNYGDNVGEHRVLQSLATFAFNYPSRQKLFKYELEQFLLFTREQHIDPLSVKGSYAGAIGMPQFLPSSYRRYAISYSKNRYIDLTHNSDDVIGSIANYLVKKGWKPKQPIAVPAQVSGNKHQALTKGLYAPKYSLANLRQHNVQPKKNNAYEFTDDVFSNGKQ